MSSSSIANASVYSISTNIIFCDERNETNQKHNDETPERIRRWNSAGCRGISFNESVKDNFYDDGDEADINR